MTTLVTARYLYKMGIIVAVDVVEAALKRGGVPLLGTLIVKMKKPYSCFFFTVGFGGMALPDTGFCVLNNTYNMYTREEELGLSNLMRSLNPDNKLPLKYTHIVMNEFLC